MPLQLIRARAVRATLVALLSAGLAGPAVAGQVYSWRTDDGTYAFTDDAKRIPAKYKSAATKRSVGSLASYERFTPTGGAEAGPYADRVERRLDGLRAANAVAEPSRHHARHHGRHHGGKTDGTSLQVYTGGGRHGGGSVGLGVPLDRSRHGGTVLIEDVRYQEPGRITSQHATIVSRDGRVLSITKSRPNNSAPNERVYER